MNHTAGSLCALKTRAGRKALRSLVYASVALIATSVIPGTVVDAEADQWPRSPFRIKWTAESHRESFTGADNWPITWARSGAQYTAWGDGPGPHNSDVSFGVARLDSGVWAPPSNRNAFTSMFEGGTRSSPCPSGPGPVPLPGDPEFRLPKVATGNDLCGKSYGILALPVTQGSTTERLHMWVSPGSGGRASVGHRSATLYTSPASGGLGTRWVRRFTVRLANSGLITPVFMQSAGPGYTAMGFNGKAADWVYVYWVRYSPRPSSTALEGLSVHGTGPRNPGRIYLSRVLRKDIGNPAAYYFRKGNRWNRVNIARPFSLGRVAAPVFKNEFGVGWTHSVSYNERIKRYILMTEHRQSFRGRLGVWEASKPWGPWRVMHTYNAWSECINTTVDWRRGRNAFYWNVSAKWTRANQNSSDSARNRQSEVVWTGVGLDDSWNTVRMEIGARDSLPRQTCGRDSYPW